MRKKRKRVPQNLAQKIKLIVSTLIGVGALLYLFFNDYGIVRHFYITRELRQIQEQIEKLKQQQSEIQNLISRLETDYGYLEKLARERLQMVKEGEELYITKEHLGSDHKEQQK